MSHRTLISRVGPLLLLGALVGLFQNCSSNPAASTQGSSQGLNLSGNGTGYGGKVVVAPTDAGQLCPDNTNIKQRIEIQNSEAKLVRDDCRDLNLSESKNLGSVSDFSSGSVQILGKEYQLESLMGNGRGQLTVNRMGVYAPSKVSDVLPTASFVEGVALGQNHILVAFTQQPRDLISVGKEVLVRLYSRQGVGLTLKQELAVAVPTTMALSDIRVLMGSFAFDDRHAVIVTHRASPFGTEALVIRRTGDQIELTDSTSALGNILHIQGHPLPNGRYLLSFVPNHLGPLRTMAFRVLSQTDGKLQMGEPLLQSTVGTYPNGPASLLPVPGQAERFETYSANTNYYYLPGPNQGLPTNEGNLIHMSVQVVGNRVVALNTPNLRGSQTEMTCCSLDFVGDAASALLTLTVQGGGHAWSKLVLGVTALFKSVSPAKGYFTGPMNMMGPENLRLGGRHFFRVPTATGTRIFYLDSLDGEEQPFATTFPRAHDFNSSRLFVSGDNLVLIESDSAHGATPNDARIHVLSTPP